MLGGSDKKGSDENQDDLEFEIDDKEFVDFPVPENRDTGDLLAQLEDPTNTKRSFEVKMDTGDSDDEVFIVHDEYGEQADMFEQTPEFVNVQTIISKSA